LQRIIVLALLVVLISSFTGLGVLGEPWNEFETISQKLGWGEANIETPTSDASLELRLIQIPGQGGASIPPLNIFEDFETGFTTWVNTGGDDNNCWKHRNSPTPSGNTGPSTGAGAGTNFYLFYESSNGCSPGTGQQAFLLGPIIDFDTFNSVEVQFWRHMWDGLGADNMGRLALELEDSPGSGTFTEVWFNQGNQGNQWDQITVDLSAADNTGQRQIRFVATEVVAGIQSDMAVDEILIQGVVAPTIISFEDFETGFTTWVNTGGDDNNCWKHRNSPTPTGNTGPMNPAPNTGAPSTSQPLGTEWYLFYESSNGCSPGTGQQAFLLGPIIDFNVFNNVEVTFWRHMLDAIGTDQMGRLALELEDSQGSGTFTEVFFLQGSNGDGWNQFTVDLSSEDNTGQRQLRFVATEVVAGIHSDMAVDEILITGTVGASSINLINSCVFTSTESIPAGSGLSQGTAICKLLNAPADEGGVAIAEGKTFFDSYVANTELEVFITQKITPNSNNNELIFDVRFIIEAPI